MAHCTTPKTLESTLLPELEESIANIQARGISQKDFDQDLNKNQKIWLVIGICLHNIISPILRENVEDVMTTMYSALVKSDHINTQTYPGHLKFYPPNGVYAYYLNYENINNNKVLGRQTQLFNYKVKDAVDLSKLFLLTNMTSYTGFDETCDLSALLGIVINVDSFHQIGKTAAANVIAFLSGTTLGLELVKEIHEETCVLAKHAQVLANHFKVIDIQISNVNNTLKELKELQQVLTDMKTNFEDRISFLEKNVIEIKSVSNIGKVY
ncbi:unnamed protein product [Mytilus edulis]|uniref:Uncharacterized protein n=1 Tax=Mytilus edulis TaxID=6550 RepID=A0A8S3Q8T9_MYTED|nr:unnamed protein product [Mytilus edulis]